MKIINQLTTKFIKLFGEDNIKVANIDFEDVKTENGEKAKTYIVTFIIFGEIMFKAYINNDITDENLLDIKIEHEYSRACDTLKTLLLKIDRHFKNEIM